jgi:hypothetical protein
VREAEEQAAEGPRSDHAAQNALNMLAVWASRAADERTARKVWRVYERHKRTLPDAVDAYGEVLTVLRQAERLEEFGEWQASPERGWSRWHTREDAELRQRVTSSRRRRV